jgi:signal transduction histidine kinase
MKLPHELANAGIESYMAIALRDPQGAPIGLLGIMDHTPLDDPEFPHTVLKIFAARATAELERVQAENERRKLERQIQHAEKLKSLGVLAGGIAHDFNNLLTGILGNANLALSKMPDDSPALLHLRRIENATKRAENLTRQMLAYSGKGTFVIVPLDLNGLVQEMSELLSTAISKTAKMDTVFAPGLPTIEADATQVRQVIMNLMMNASDSLEGRTGTVGVRTGLVEVHEDEVDPSALSKSMSPGRHIFVEVSDSGAGMDDETRRRMFDPFFSTKFAGRGLGMSAVLGIVQRHRGGIQVDSAVGVGTTIRVMFPASAKPVPDELTRGAVRSLHGGERTALVVDDEEMVREVIRNVLLANGLRVVTARDGFEALELLEGRPELIDLVLLDLTMPGMDGSAALEKIRSIDSNVPVVLMSGYDEKDATLRFGDGSLAGFLQKPFDASALMGTIEQVLAD